MKTWNEVTNSNEFTSLSADQQEDARQQYFNQVVAPKVKTDSLQDAKAQFDAQTSSSIKDKGEDKPRGFFDKVGDFANAAIHNAAKPIHGLTQAVEHGLASAADYVDPNSKPGGQRSNWNQSFQNTVSSDDAALRKWEADYQAETPNNVASYAGATAGTIIPFLATGVSRGLQAVGDTAASLIPKFAPAIVPKVVSGAAQGAALSLTAPVESSDGNYWNEKAKQAKTMAVLGGAVPIVAAGARGIYDVAKPFVNPNGVVSDALKKWIPSGQSALQNADELVPGSLPTTAQVAANPEIVAAEKALANNPKYRPQFEQRAIENNEARLAAINGIAKTPEALDAAIVARKAATDPWREEAFQTEANPIWRQNLSTAKDQVQSVLEKSPRMSAADFDALQQAKTLIGSAQRGEIDSHTLYNTLAGLEISSKTAANAIQGAGDALMNTGKLVDATSVLRKLEMLRASSLGTDPVIKKGALDIAKGIQEGIENTGEGAKLIRPDLLDGYRQNVKTFLQEHASNGAVANKQEAAFEPMRNAIVDAIEGANPGYRNYLESYAKHSVPINTMEAGQSILASLDSAAANAGGSAALTLPKISTQLRKATSGTYGIAPEADASLRGIQADLQRASTSNGLRSGGSDTAYNLQADGWLGKSLYGENFKGGRFADAIGGAIGAVAGGWAGAGFGYLGSSKLAALAQNRVNDVLAEALLNPAKARALLQESQQNPILLKILEKAPQAGLLLENNSANRRTVDPRLVPMSKRPVRVADIGAAKTVDEAIQAAGATLDNTPLTLQ